jgi:hypothetical protein
MRSITVANALMALLVGACSGTSTGNPLGDGRGEEGPGPAGADGRCRKASTAAVGIDESTTLGFAPREALQTVLGTHEQPLAWKPPQIGSYGPEAGEQVVTIAIATASTSFQLVEYEPNDGGELAPAIPVDCKDLLEGDVNVEVRSSMGALSESFKATLTIESPHVARLYHKLDPAMLMGTFMMSGVREQGYELRHLWIDLQISGGQLTGALQSMLVKRTGADTSEEVAATIATW